MKKYLYISVIIFSIIIKAAPAEQEIGVIAQIDGRNVIVKHKNGNKPFKMGDKLHVVQSDNKIVILEVTFPMQAYSQCKVVSGDISKLVLKVSVYYGDTLNMDGDLESLEKSFIGIEKDDRIDKAYELFGYPDVDEYAIEVSMHTMVSSWNIKNGFTFLRIYYDDMTGKVDIISIDTVMLHFGCDDIKKKLKMKNVQDNNINCLGKNSKYIIEVYGNDYEKEIMSYDTIKYKYIIGKDNKVTVVFHLHKDRCDEMKLFLNHFNN